MGSEVKAASSAPKISADPRRRVRVQVVCMGISRRSSCWGGRVWRSPFLGGGLGKVADDVVGFMLYFVN